MTDSFKEDDLERVLALADQISGDRQESLRWLQRPLRQFNDQTPEHLVSTGRAGDLIDFLESLSSGYVGCTPLRPICAASRKTKK